MMERRVDVAVIGGGIAGLCVADQLRRESPDVVVRVYEASDRAGGKLLTERIELDDGRFIVEAGPDAWLAQKPWATELVADLGLAEQVIPINRLPRPVAILTQGHLVDLPEGVSLIAPSKIRPFLRSPLLSPRGKLRLVADLVLRPKKADADESLGAFVERRFGREALDWIAEPIAAGIYNADPHQMSLLATFPQLRKLEQQHGSVIRGLRRGAKGQSPLSRQNGRGAGGEGFRSADGPPTNVVAGLRTRLGLTIRHGRWKRIAIIDRFAWRRPGLKAGAQHHKAAEAGSFSSPFSGLIAPQPGHLSPGDDGRTIAGTPNGSHSHPKAGTEPRHYDSHRPPTFLTLRDGMQTLVDALIERVSDTIEVNAAVTGNATEPTGGYRLSFADQPDVHADHVVLTVPAAVAAGLLAEVAPEAADRLRELRAVHAGAISLAFRTADIPRPLPGYGLVIPAKEGRPINAVTVASRKFAGRAPAGWELLRVFFGGYRSPQTMRLDDAALLEMVTAELRDLLGITAPPAFHRVHRWPAGSPQYDVGHLDRVTAIEAALPSEITVTGSPYRGVGIPDVIREASSCRGRWQSACAPTKQA